jgi:N-acetylmuramoyl-L-alanine amidase
VVDLQTRLHSAGFELGSRGIDGAFDNDTERVVKAFQQSVGVLADGVVGPVTWWELVESGYRPGGRLLYLRQPPFRGADVMQLQRMLNDLGFDPGAVNGLFDARTARAAADFQRNTGLAADGAVDSDTFKVLGTYASQSLSTHPLPDKHGGYFADDLFSGTIVVDAAHGGCDTGYATPDGGPSEADLNLAIAMELAQILPAREVILTRSDDVEVSNSNRAYLANTSGASMVISIHHASYHSPRANGTATFHFDRLGYQSHRGQMAATYVQRGVSRVLETTDLGEFGRSYEILRETNIPALVMEPLHLTNPENLRLARDGYYPVTVAEAVTESLEQYSGRDAGFIAV